MHELGTLCYVVDTVEELAKEQKLTKIHSITLEVGEVSGIITDYMVSFWEYLRKDTELLKETELKLETIKAVTYCQDCKGTYSTLEFGKECPYCHSTQTFLVTGNEFMIKEIEAM